MSSNSQWPSRDAGRQRMIPRAASGCADLPWAPFAPHGENNFHLSSFQFLACSRQRLQFSEQRFHSKGLGDPNFEVRIGAGRGIPAGRLSMCTHACRKKAGQGWCAPVGLEKRSENGMGGYLPGSAWMGYDGCALGSGGRKRPLNRFTQ
jgi:hypothetical protein